MLAEHIADGNACQLRGPTSSFLYCISSLVLLHASHKPGKGEKETNCCFKPLGALPNAQKEKPQLSLQGHR